MLITFVGGVVVAVAAGSVFYGLDLILPVSIPLLYPALAGGLVGLATLRLGSTIGRCRNPRLAVLVAVLAGSAAWGTGHVAGYLQFRSEAYSSLLGQHPQAQPAQIDRVIDLWLADQTGQSGFIGYMLLKAASTSIEIQHVVSGAALPPMSLSGAGLIGYWLVELAVTAGVAGYFNRNYSKAPYCDKCHAWRRYRTLVIGTSANLDDTVGQLRQHNISAALFSLRQRPEGNIVRLEVEYCPTCYDSRLAKLVVVEDTGPKTWLEKTVWADKLEPRDIQQMIASAD
jgi:hypothetical protein